MNVLCVVGVMMDATRALAVPSKPAAAQFCKIETLSIKDGPCIDVKGTCCCTASVCCSPAEAGIEFDAVETAVGI